MSNLAFIILSESKAAARVKTDFSSQLTQSSIILLHY